MSARTFHAPVASGVCGLGTTETALNRKGQITGTNILLMFNMISLFQRTRIFHQSIDDMWEERLAYLLAGVITIFR